MTTYYGVWSDTTKEWWFVGDRKLFCVTMLGLAKAQAMVANQIGRMANWSHSWEARAIGADGLPVPVPETVSLSELKAKLMRDPEFRAEYEAFKSGVYESRFYDDRTRADFKTLLTATGDEHS